MAIGWLTVLKSVPWTEVVHNAPRVAEGARKLWKIARRPATAANGAAGASSRAFTTDRTFEALEKKITDLEGTASELQNQMAASSELIKALADQNAQLVQRLEAMHARAFWLTATVAVLGIVASAALALALFR